MEIDKIKSLRCAKEILDERNALGACHTLATEFDGQLKENENRLNELGFQPEKVFDAGGNQPRFDAYSETWKIGVEREWREQMHCRSHLLFSEIAFRKNLIDVAVFILPTTEIKKIGVNFNRTVKELSEYEIFRIHFPITVPLYLIGCTK